MPYENEIDSNVKRYRDASITGSVSVVGLNAFNCDGGFLTFIDDASSEQPYVTRDDLVWLRDVGIPAWLREMDSEGGT
jgi:hypothetical protein